MYPVPLTSGSQFQYLFKTLSRSSFQHWQLYTDHEVSSNVTAQSSVNRIFLDVGLYVSLNRYLKEVLVDSLNFYSVRRMFCRISYVCESIISYQSYHYQSFRVPLRVHSFQFVGIEVIQTFQQNR